jgi:ankyrin repeat protein
VFRYIYSKGGSLKSKNLEGDTCLHIASRSGMTTLVRFLSTHINLEEPNNMGNTPLMEACLKNKNITVIQNLISYGASIDSKNNNNMTPINIALLNYNLDVVFFLFSRIDKNKMIECLKDSIPKIEEITHEMDIKKINLDKVDKEFNE